MGNFEPWAVAVYLVILLDGWNIMLFFFFRGLKNWNPDEIFPNIHDSYITLAINCERHQHDSVFWNLLISICFHPIFFSTVDWCITVQAWTETNFSGLSLKIRISVFVCGIFLGFIRRMDGLGAQALQCFPFSGKWFSLLITRIALKTMFWNQ